MTRRTLLGVAIATHCVPDLATVTKAYVDLLGFRIIESGKLSQLLCAVWDAPAMVGMGYVLLQPASGTDVYLRFIETGRSGGYWPPVTLGWIATEMLATDPDALAAELEGSAFTRIGGPADLYPSPKSARAMQTAGPAGELMYFTRILPGGSRFGLKGAQSYVDRPFIMVVGGHSMEDLHSFYGDVLGQRITVSQPFVIRQMSRVLGCDSETSYPVSLAHLPGRRFLLELEEFPADVPSRTRPEGQLPEGLAMVSFMTASLADLAVPFRAPSRAIAEAPYHGRKVAVIEGPAGEWLELISEEQ